MIWAVPIMETAKRACVCGMQATSPFGLAERYGNREIYKYI